MKITKEELENIIKEEVEKALGEQEQRIELDNKGVPLKAPPLPKNWRKLPFNDLRRSQYRKWYNKYGPGSKRKKAAAAKPAPKKAKSDLDKILDAPSQKAAAKPAAKPAAKDTKPRTLADYPAVDKKPTAAAKPRRRTINPDDLKQMDAEKKSFEAELRALGIPTEDEFIKAATERAKKGQPEKGWWGKDTKFRGNLGLWKNSMLNKYRNNIKKFIASVRKKKGNQKDTNPLAKYPAVDKKASAQKKPPFPSEQEWMKKNRKKYATTSIASKVYSAKKAAYEARPAGFGTTGGPTVYKKTVEK